MGILSAAIEANGWVLAVTGDWPATAGAWEFAGDDRTEGRYLLGGEDQFPLDPSGVPKLVLTIVRQGFTRQGGMAVPSVGDERLLVAVKPLRRAWPQQIQIDETDHGDGTRTLRLALSDRVYAGDVVKGAVFSAGWKVGQGSASVAGIANNSARPLPVAVSRWAQPSFTLVRGTTLMDVDVIVAAAHPRHVGARCNQAIAALKITATDGAATKTFWFTSDRTSPQYGDDLLCWGGQIDLAGLNPGPVTIHREEFPWVGASRSTGSGQSTDTTNANPIGWAAPLVVCYDPAGALYPDAHVFVDAATGTTTPANVTVAATLAAARAGTRAADISTAVQAIYLANRTLPARNGWAADTARAMDWATITLAAGVQVWGATGVTSGANCNEGRLVIRGDPADADPRANCIWRTGSAAPTKQVARFWLQDMQVQGGESVLGGGLWHLDNVEVLGKPGFEGATTGIFSGTSPTGYAILSATRMRWWKYGATAQGSNTRALLLRNCEHSRNAEAVVHISSSKIVDPLFTARNVMAFGTWGTSAFANSDAMLWGCKAMDWAGRFTSIAGCWNSGAGTQASPATYLRFAVVNALCERSKGNSGERIWGIGESAYDQMQDCIFEGLTMQGNGWNAGYNDSPSPHGNLRHVGNIVRNCVFGRHATKHDIFKANGSLTGSWEYLYGVGFAGNVHGNQNSSTASNFQFAFFGVGSAVDIGYAGYGSNAFLKFAADKSDYGPDAAAGVGPGWGDYGLTPGAPMHRRGVTCCVDRDLDNVARGASFASGAVEPQAQPHAAVAGASAMLGHVAGVAGLTAVARVAPAASRLSIAGGGAALTVALVRRAVGGGRTLRVDEDQRMVRAQRD